MIKKMFNIFFANSPLQLLCAIEATFKFGLSNNVLVIFNKGASENFKQIENILKNHPNRFDKIEYVDRELKSIMGWLNGFAKFEKLISRYPVSEYIFIGDFGNSLIRHFCNSINYQYIYIIDDGFATIRTYHHLDSDFRDKKKDYVKWVLSRFSLRYKAPSDVGFFTIFDKYISHNKTIANEMKSLHGGNKNKNEDIYWIGSPIVEDGIVSADYYFSALTKYCGILNKEKEIIYIPHRRESLNKLDRLKKEMGLTIKHIACPIELFFLNENTYPSIILSFFSTALFTLNKLMQNSAIYYIPIEDDFILTRKEHVKNIYSILRCEVENFQHYRQKSAK